MTARKPTGPAFGYGFEPAATSPNHTVADAPLAPHAPRQANAAIGLVDDDGAAEFFNCSKRTFTDFMDAHWMPRPIRLGPRLRRWSIDELRAAVAAMPREAARQTQPTPLRARIDALKGATGAGHAQ